MGLDLLDLVFRLEKWFGVRIICGVAGSPLYDSEFDPPAVVKKNGGTRAPQDLWGDQDDGSSPGAISVLSGSPLTAWSSLALTARSQTEYAIRRRETRWSSGYRIGRSSASMLSAGPCRSR